MTANWEEIDGFVSPGEFDAFQQHIRRLVALGVVSELVADPGYERGLVYGGVWYQVVETGEIWRLVPPDFPFRGLWEKVEGAEAPRTDGSAIEIGQVRVQMPCQVKEAFCFEGRTIVLLDPDAYLTDPDFPAERRRGNDPLRNLRAYSTSGELLWEAEFPEPADYYYRIVSRSPLVVLSFSSYRCRIDPETGRILEARFVK